MRRSLALADGFGFLVAVIADYGVPSAWAWALPVDLESRLGSLAPALVLSRPSEVVAAIRRRPQLHRFGRAVGDWIVDAAGRVARDFDGDASRLWSGTPRAGELQKSLQRFAGIGPKKAAMAVSLLERHCGIAFTGLEDTEAAYDIHVRRVFLRSGLMHDDSVDALRTAARMLNPEHPAALDEPAWFVGRSWCTKTDPVCGSCFLSSGCARRLEAASSVRSV